MKLKVNKKEQLIIYILAIINFIFISILKENPSFVEMFYSSKIYICIALGLNKIFAYFPFSVWEYIYIALLLCPIFIIGKIIVNVIYKKNRLRADSFESIRKLSLIFTLIYITFNILWGYNYYRKPLIKLVNYEVRDNKIEDLVALCNEVINNINFIRPGLKENREGVFTSNVTFYEMSDLAKDGFKNISIKGVNLNGNYSNAKPVILSKLMSYTGITGMYSPYTGEANINNDIPINLIPATICHEMAHQRGIAREEEANYIAYLACINNQNKEFQYSGYYLALTYLMNNLYNINKELYKELRENYCDGLKRDIKYNNEYWKSREGLVDKIWNKINDSFLKSNNQSAGVESYGQVTKLLLAEYKIRQVKLTTR